MTDSILGHSEWPSEQQWNNETGSHGWNDKGEARGWNEKSGAQGWNGQAGEQDFPNDGIDNFNNGFNNDGFESQNGPAGNDTACRRCGQGLLSPVGSGSCQC